MAIQIGENKMSNNKKHLYRADINGGSVYFGVLAKDEKDAMKKVLEYLLNTDADELNNDGIGIEIEYLNTPLPTEENPVVRE